MKLLNSLILGVPVLGFAPTLPDMTGVISVHSKEERSKRLSSLLDNCASLKELGRRARAEVLSKHLWEKKARDTEKIYNSLNTK